MTRPSSPINKTIQLLRMEDKIAFKDDVRPQQLVDFIEGDSEGLALVIENRIFQSEAVLKEIRDFSKLYRT